MARSPGTSPLTKPDKFVTCYFLELFQATHGTNRLLVYLQVNRLSLRNNQLKFRTKHSRRIYGIYLHLTMENLKDHNMYLVGLGNGGR